MGFCKFRCAEKGKLHFILNVLKVEKDKDVGKMKWRASHIFGKASVLYKFHKALQVSHFCKEHMLAFTVDSCYVSVNWQMTKLRENCAKKKGFKSSHHRRF